MNKANSKRALLTELRGGDYAHAGDKEAVDFLLKKLPDIEELKKGNVLDLGCGYGGTAAYMQKKGFTTIWGIDIDKNAIDYAKLNYPSVQFIHLDAKELSLFKKIVSDLKNGELGGTIIFATTVSLTLSLQREREHT